MAPAPSRFAPVSKSTFVLTVTGYASKQICGVLHAPLGKKRASFSNLVQLLLLMDAHMSAANFPQHSMEPRAFQASQGTFEFQQAAQKQASPLATFEINVMFRQNASWQGSILWRDRMLESRFRSVLELVGLMDDALTAAG